MSSTGFILLLNLTLSATLTGMIWTIQIVHYPGFMGVGSENFLAYQQTHMRTISYVVIPLMLAELTVSLLLSFFFRPPIHWTADVATGLVLLIWLSTFFVSSPLHSKLATEGYNPSIIRQLVSTNWIRTVGWTIRSGILFCLVAKMMKS